MEEKAIINLEEKENIAKFVNYSPNGHLKTCTDEQRETNKTCREHVECLNEEWPDGCTSSHALEHGEHYFNNISSENVKEKRCFFMVTKHPDDGNRYFSGLIFISDIVDWENAKGGVGGTPIPFVPKTVKCTWNQPRGERLVSNKETLEILKEYHSKTGDKKVKEIIDFYETGKSPKFEDALEEVTRLILDMPLETLKRKKQIILYGPPGTGKTLNARKLATYFVEGGN